MFDRIMNTSVVFVLLLQMSISLEQLFVFYFKSGSFLARYKKVNEITHFVNF